MYLLIRLADLRAKHLIECHINGHFLTQVAVSWHGAIPSWIDAEGEFSAPDEEKRVRILGFQQPSDMGPFVMDDIDI